MTKNNKFEKILITRTDTGKHSEVLKRPSKLIAQLFQSNFYDAFNFEIFCMLLLLAYKKLLLYLRN